LFDISIIPVIRLHLHKNLGKMLLWIPVPENGFSLINYAVAAWVPYMKRDKNDILKSKYSDYWAKASYGHRRS